MVGLSTRLVDATNSNTFPITPNNVYAIHVFEHGFELFHRHQECLPRHSAVVVANVTKYLPSLVKRLHPPFKRTFKGVFISCPRISINRMRTTPQELRKFWTELSVWHSVIRILFFSFFQCNYSSEKGCRSPSRNPSSGDRWSPGQILFETGWYTYTHHTAPMHLSISASMMVSC